MPDRDAACRNQSYRYSLTELRPVSLRCEMSQAVSFPGTPIAPLRLLQTRPSQIARSSRCRTTRCPLRHSAALPVHGHLANSKYLALLKSFPALLVRTLILSVLLSELVVKACGNPVLECRSLSRSEESVIQYLLYRVHAESRFLLSDS
jgi:hypothetical protein